MTLTFNEKAHRYRLDGKPVPSVTTLLKGGLPAPALPYWAARTVAEWVADHDAEVDQLRGMGRNAMVAALKETPWAARDRAGIRGTEIHDYAEKIAHGETVEVPDLHADAVDGYVRWLDEWQPEVVLTERPCANRKWHYAGKFDAIVKMRGETWLLDWKTARGVYGDNALQVALYANAEFYVDPDGTEHTMPQIDRLGVVHIQPTVTDLYALPAEANAPAFKDALHVLWTAKAKDRIASYLGSPQTTQTATETAA